MATDPYHNKKHIPSKRLKNWHRPSAHRIGLRDFADSLIAKVSSNQQPDQDDIDRAKTASAWYANKAAQ